MKLFSTKKKIAAVVMAGGLVAGTAGIAAAYFTASGSGSGNLHVATASAPVVTFVSSTGGTLYPGGPAVTMKYNVKNTSPAHMTLSAFSAALKFTRETPPGTETSNGVPYIITATGTVVLAPTVTTAHNVKTHEGCLSSWFTLGLGGISDTLPPGGTATITIPVTMTDVNVPQNSCQGATPTLTLTALTATS